MSDISRGSLSESPAKLDEQHTHECTLGPDDDFCASRGYCQCICGAWMGESDDEWMPPATFAPNCVMIWLTKAEMEWVQDKGKIRIERDVIKQPSGYLRIGQ